MEISVCGTPRGAVGVVVFPMLGHDQSTKHTRSKRHHMLGFVYGMSQKYMHLSEKYTGKLYTYVVQMVVQIVVRMVVQSMPFVFHVSSWQPTRGWFGKCEMVRQEVDEESV